MTLRKRIFPTEFFFKNISVHQIKIPNRGGGQLVFLQTVANEWNHYDRAQKNV